MRFIKVGLASLLLAGASTAAMAERASVTADLNMRTGPGTRYPVVETIPNGRDVRIFGCVRGLDWCDVSYRGDRGWVFADYLRYRQAGDWRVLPRWGARIDLPILSFSLGDYAHRHYRGTRHYDHLRRWARDRDDVAFSAVFGDDGIEFERGRDRDRDRDGRRGRHRDGDREARRGDDDRDWDRDRDRDARRGDRDYDRDRDTRRGDDDRDYDRDRDRDREARRGDDDMDRDRNRNRDQRRNRSDDDDDANRRQRESSVETGSGAEADTGNASVRVNGNASAGSETGQRQRESNRRQNPPASEQAKHSASARSAVKADDEEDKNND